MATPTKFDAQLGALQALRGEPDSAASRAELQRGLLAKSSALVTVAANVIAHSELSGFTAELCAAFDRFMLEPTRNDKGCSAKTAIAHALHRTRAECDALFLRAVRHVQLEPVWGGKHDTAAELRATAALALVNSDYADVMHELARLLADREVTARAGAAQALGATRHVDAATPLLRYKILLGDDDWRVISACLSSLLGTAPAESLAFVAELLSDASEPRREAAAIALGESRLDGAFGPLRDACERAVLPEERKAPLLGLSLLRTDAAWDYVLGVMRQGSDGDARVALEALAVFRHDPTLRERALQAARERDDDLHAAARDSFAELP